MSPDAAHYNIEESEDYFKTTGQPAFYHQNNDETLNLEYDTLRGNLDHSSELTLLKEEIHKLKNENHYLKGYATQISQRKHIWYKIPLTINRNSLDSKSRSKSLPTTHNPNPPTTIPSPIPSPPITQSPPIKNSHSSLSPSFLSSLPK